MDLSERGGWLISNRVLSPARIRINWCTMAVMCQFGRYGVPGNTVPKHFQVKEYRSLRSSAARAVAFIARFPPSFLGAICGVVSLAIPGEGIPQGPLRLQWF